MSEQPESDLSVSDTPQPQIIDAGPVVLLASAGDPDEEDEGK